MKRGKDEEKMMGPMFPRLHVNDTEKGGPRAPPRNKMALYEQLSIPSQRFSPAVLPFNPSNTAANTVPPSSQGGRKERVMFFSHQLPPRHQSEKQYSQYSDLSTPLTQVEQRKKMDEDDFTVPIFIHSIPSQECGEYTNDMDAEQLSPSNPSYFNHTSKFQKAKMVGVLERSMRQEGKSQKEENSEELVAGRFKAFSNSSIIEETEGLKKKTDSSLCHEPEDDPANSIDRLKTDDSVQPELRAESQPASERHVTAVSRENLAAVDKRNSSTTVRTTPSEDMNIVHDLSNYADPEDRSYTSLQMGNSEGGDSVSETSVVDSVSVLDITPDDVVGIIGQKHFWKARRAIANQQRVFAVQIFELHRLIKVQRLIAASPHLLHDDTAYLSTMKALPRKRLPLNYPVKAIPNVSEQKGDPEEPSHKKECSAENTLGKSSFSSIQNDVPPSSCRPLGGNSPAPSMGSDHNARPWCFNQPHGHQWLIPVMSPSEGLVYKPYPGPGFVGPTCGGYVPHGSNPVMGNFVPSAYGVPAPHPQYQFPSFPPAGPPGYFPPYGMPIMNTAAFSGSSVEQMNGQAMKGQFSAGEANGRIQLQSSFTMPIQKNKASPDALKNLHASEDVEVQASSPSSPSERLQSSRASNAMEGRNVLPLFPTSPAIDPPNSSPQPPEPERPTQVIKVVPHNARTATESAARIFRSIQEERKQYDSV